jgi:hypothetical protein
MIDSVAGRLGTNRGGPGAHQHTLYIGAGLHLMPR